MQKQQTLRVATVSMESVKGEPQRNLVETIRLINELEQAGVDFALFPEMNISAYIKDAKLIEDFLQQSELICNELKQVSSTVKLAFAVGFPIKHKGEYFIGHHVFENGEQLFTYLKTHLGPTEQGVYSPGNAISTVLIKGFVIGLQLCFETHLPELSYAQAKSGADILAMAFASPRETSNVKLERLTRYLPARAYDNACYVMACNQGGSRFAALGLIINPKGIVLKQNSSCSSSFCLAEIEKSEISRIKESSMGWFNKYKRTAFLKSIYNG